MGTMKEADKLGFSGRVERLKPAVHQAFDTQNMARIAVGPRWSSLSDEQRKQVIEAFTQFIIATYANRFDGYANEHFVVKSANEANDGATVVESQMLRSEGEPINFNYVLRQSDGAWRISDILFGAVSELANRRAEFTAVIRRDGVDGLIAELHRKARDLENP
jgi:phospholipid transport system substrate-binding protein